MFSSRFALLASFSAVLTVAPSLHGAAQIIIQNDDAPGMGFNDATPAAPVGGNPGTTIGQQRLIVFKVAAGTWGARLQSSIPTVVAASFPALDCDATTGVLGSAGPTYISRNFTNAPKANTWYTGAQANALSGVDQDPDNPEISSRFNNNLGTTGCLETSHFYYGLDHNELAADIDFLAVVTHELGHGLGFLTTTDKSTGAYESGSPSIYDWHLFDNTQNKYWVQLTAAQRKTSAISGRNLTWRGGYINAYTPLVLQLGTPLLTVSAPAGLAGSYQVGTAEFGPPLASPGLTDSIVAVKAAGAVSTACTALTPLQTASVNGKMALIKRGDCAFVVKVLNCQNAGAVGVIIEDNVPDTPPAGLGGVDPTITIPSVRITQADGAKFEAVLLPAAPPAVTGNLGLDTTVRAGADAAGHPYLYAPNPVVGGSSISHWDTLATPNQLMEPFINSDLTGKIIPPQDLSLGVMYDMGWPKP